MDLDFSAFANAGVPQGGAEEPGLRAQFYTKAVENPRKSREQGRPIFDELEYVKLVFVGDKSTEVDQRVKDEHRERWPKAYAAFKAGQANAASGTPLEQWPLMSMHRVAELKALKIYAVEELAGLTDAGIQRLGIGGRELVQQAKLYLDAAAGQSVATRLQGENEQLKAEASTMRQQITELADRVKAMEAAEKPRKA